MILSTILSLLFLFQISGQPQRQPQRTTTEQPRQQQSAAPEQKEEAPIIKKQSVLIQGKTLNYTTTTGFMPIKNSTSGETEARIFYIAYTLDNPPAKRPLLFSFNGGPGSSSVWLHLGALGPKRTKMLDDGNLPPPPYQLVPNEGTWFTETDIVF